jgi:hypothetical protein
LIAEWPSCSWTTLGCTPACSARVWPSCGAGRGAGSDARRRGRRPGGTSSGSCAGGRAGRPRRRTRNPCPPRPRPRASRGASTIWRWLRPLGVEMRPAVPGARGRCWPD